MAARWLQRGATEAVKEISQDKVPATLDEAVQMLYDALEPADLAVFRNTEPGNLHHGFGRFLRNHWSLWDDTPVTRDIKQRFGIFGHGDDISAILLHMLWEKVKGRKGTAPWLENEHTVEALVEKFKVHWRKYGVDPATGKKL